MARKRRIVFFAPQFAEISTRLAEALSARADVLLILDGRQRRAQVDPNWFRSATANLKVIEFRADRRPWRLLWTPILLMAGMLFRPDIVHLQEQADAITARVARYFRARAPVVATVHDAEPHIGSDARFLEAEGKPFREMIRADAALFHVQSDFTLAQLRSLWPDRPIVRTEHGLMHAPESGQLRASEPGRVLFFGRMEAYKGLEVLIAAAERLAAQGRAFKLVLAGRGEEMDRLRSRAEQASYIEVVSHFLSCYEVVEQFQRAELVILPYLEASQSGVAAAALANGRPLIASRIGGLPEIVQHGLNGLLVEPSDVEGLASAIDRFLADEALRRQLTEGAVKSAATLDWNHVAEALSEAYERLLADRPKQA